MYSTHERAFHEEHFADIDGPSGGPNVYCGNIGVRLQTCQQLNVARFPPLIIDAEFHSDLISVPITMLRVVTICIFPI